MFEECVALNGQGRCRRLDGQDYIKNEEFSCGLHFECAQVLPQEYKKEVIWTFWIWFSDWWGSTHMAIVSE